MKIKSLTRPFSHLAQYITSPRTSDSATVTRGHSNPPREDLQLASRASRAASPEGTSPAAEGSLSSPLRPRVKLEKRPHYLVSCLPWIKKSSSRTGTTRNNPEPEQSGAAAQLRHGPVESSPVTVPQQAVMPDATASRIAPVNLWDVLHEQAQREGLIPPPLPPLPPSSQSVDLGKILDAPVPREQVALRPAPEVSPPAKQDIPPNTAIDQVFQVTPPVHNPHPMSVRTRRTNSRDSNSTASLDRSLGSRSASDVSLRSQRVNDNDSDGDRQPPRKSTLQPSSSNVSQTQVPAKKKLVWKSRSPSPPRVETGPSEDRQVLPLTGRRDGKQAVDPLPKPADWGMLGMPTDLHTFADIPLQPRDYHVIDIDPPGSSQVSPPSPSAGGSGRAVTDQLALVARSVLPLQKIVRSFREEPPAEPPGELAMRMNQRFDLYVKTEVHRPLDMPLMLEFAKERERQLALPKSDQNWDKAVQVYKQAFKLHMPHVEKAWHTAGTIYPLSTIPAGVVALLPGLTTLPFSSIKPLPGAWLNFGLQLGLAMATPALSAGLQNFFVNLQELKRIGGLPHRSPALAGAMAPEFNKATENIEKALSEVDAALAALHDEKAGPAEVERAAKAEQQLIAASQAYERRVDVNNINYTAQRWQNYTRSARQAAYFMAPVLGNYVRAGENARKYITYGIQVAATAGQWLAQQFAAPRDEKNRQDTTILATLKHTEVRKASAIEGKVAPDDLTEEDIDTRKFRDQWRGPTKVRLMSVTDILLDRIEADLSSAAKLAGLSQLEWVTLQGLESRRHQSPEPLDPSELARLTDLRQQPHDRISRGELLEWMRLEQRAREPLSEAENRLFGALEKKFATSALSEHTWARLDELADKSAAAPDLLTWPEHEELAQLRELSATSLTVVEHALLETLRIRSKFSPAAKDIATRDQLEAKAGLSDDERAVLTRASRAQGSEILPANADDFLAMGAIRRKLRSKLDDKELADHGEALSRISSGLTPNEKKQYVELRNKGRFKELDPQAQAQLRDLEQHVQEVRLDQRLLAWDWSKLSQGTQQVMDDALSGGSDLQFAWQVTKVRMGRRQEITPELAQRYGSAFQLVFGGSTMPFIVGAGFRLASAMGKKVDFEAIRIPAGLATLAIGVMGAWASGALINFKITERNRLRKLSEEAPSATQLLLSSIPRAMVALPAEIRQLRRSAKVAADGTQWLARQGDHLRLAIRHVTQRAEAQQVPGGTWAVDTGPQVTVPQNTAVASPSAGGPDLTRSGTWHREMDKLLAAIGDAQRRAGELRLWTSDASAGTQHRSAVHPAPA